MQMQKDITKRIYKEAKDRWLMQIATSVDNQPWIANIFFVMDEQLNFYWLSFPNRRHSRELAVNNNAALSIAIKTDKPVIGVQAEGTVEQIARMSVIEKILPLYVKKYGQGKDFITLAKAGKNQHILYKFSPVSLQLFDEVNFKPEENPIVLFFTE